MKKALSGILASVMVLGTVSAAAPISVQAEEREDSERTVAYTVYVSPEGDDTRGDGSKEQPFATIEKAKEKVRTLDKNSGDIVVEIADGTYELDDTIVFDENDSGNENCTIYYEAAEGADPVISGGKVLDSEWTEAEDVDWLDDGITAYKTTLDRDDKLRAIYVNGERASMTRKSGRPIQAVGSYSITAGQADWAWISKDNIPSGNVFDSSFGLPADTRNPQNIELESGSTWVKAIVCAESLEETSDGNTQVNFQMPYAAIAQNLDWNTGYQPSGNNDVVNVFEWLSEPGEFYFDQEGSTLYYIPKEGEDINTAEVVVPELETLFDVKGSVPKSEYAQHITFKGLTFAYSDWNLEEVDGSHGNATVQGCTVANKFASGNWHNEMYRSYDVPPAAIHVTSAHDINIMDGSVEMTGYLGIHLENDVFDCEITGNYIGHTGGGGITIGHPQHIYENDGPEHQVSSQYAGPDKEKFQNGTEAVPKNIYITNNYLLENCYFFPGNSPIASFFTQNMWIEHNFIYKCSYSAMSIGWGWCNFDGTEGSDSQLPGLPTTTSRNNHVNYNRVEEICSILQDAGGIYTLGQQGEGTPGGTDYSQYSEMSNNYINAFRTPTVADGSRMVNGFHPDEGSAYIKFDSNVVTNIIRNVYEMNNWRRKHDMVVTNGFSNTNRSETTAPNCTLEQYVNEDYIWPKAGNNIVLNSGLEDEYTYMVSKDVMPDSYYELASNVRLSPGDTLNRRGLLDADDEVWLAPEGTVEFAEGADMTKAAGNEKTIQVPETLGEYKLYIKYADGEVSDASEFTVYVGERKAIANVSEGREYNVSQLAPLTLELDTDNYTFTLNDERISNGYTISTEGEWVLKATPIGESEAAETINFTTSVTDANKLLPKNVTVSPEGTVEFAESLNDAGKTIWLAPSGLSAFDENDPTQSKASGDSTSMKAPKEAGSYILTVVDTESGAILSQSDAKVRVLNMVTAGNGIAVYGTPTLGGDTSDPIWNSAPSLVLEKHLTMENGPASGTAKVMWDDENLYVLVEVQDPVLNSDASSPHEKDSVEIFVDETNCKASSYQAGMGQYRISYENEQTFNGTGIEEGFESYARIVNDGYVIEAKIPFKTTEPAANAEIGFDVQINDAGTSGTRQDIIMWYDETGNSWQSGTNWGEVTLEEESDIPTNGLDIWLSSDRGLTLGGEDGTSVLKWESQGISDVTFEADENSAPTLSTNENGVTSLLFDGTSDVMEFDGVDYNGKSELTMIVATNYTGEKVGNPEGDWTSGDKYSALYVTETGSGWGGLFVSPYQDWVAARFGTGQQFCNIKYVRPEEINRTSVTAAVKSGSTEKMYVDGENVVTKEGTAETTTNIGSTMYVGKSICEGKDNFFQGTISEILIYDRALADAEIEQISTYLNQKYVSALDSITVSGPTKTEYKIGEELDLAGLEVTAHYSDGSEVAVEDYEVSGFDSSTAGEKTVTVTYEGKTATFTVNVLPDDDTDKTELENLYNQYKDLTQSGYTQDTWEAFQNALTQAETILNSEDVSQEEVDAACEALKTAAEGLRASKATLEYYLNSAKAHIEAGDVDDCVESVQKLFEEAVAEGEAVMANDSATKQEITNAALKLLKAIHALDMKAADKTDLEMAVELAGLLDLTDYVEAGQQEFTDALAAANEVLNNGDAMQEETDEAWNALVAAMENLRLKANKDALEALLNEVAELDLNRYTEESVQVFRVALASAQAVFSDETLSVDDQQTVDDAVKELNEAKDGLVAKTDDSGDTGDTGDGNQDDQKPDDGNQNTGDTGDGNQNSGDNQKPDNNNQNQNDGTNDANSVNKPVQTGDTTPVGAMLLLVIVSGAAAAAVIVRRKHR